MSGGGAPSWVYKREIESTRASYNSWVSELEEKIKKLENENLRLRNDLAQMSKAFEECKSGQGLRNVSEVEQTPLAKLEESITLMIEDFNSNRFRPNSEQDVVACIYHQWLRRHPSDQGSLHVEARIGNIQTKQHSDIAYGKTQDNNKGRPSVIQPQLVAEVKSFWGLTLNQSAKRRGEIEVDILALADKSLADAARAHIIFDMLPTSRNFLDAKYNLQFSELMKGKKEISTFIVRFSESKASLFTKFM